MSAEIVVGFLLLAVLLPLALNEAGELAPWLAERLVRWGARRLGSARATERYTEEWLANLQYVPGKLTKLTWAWGIVLWSVPQLRWQLHRRARRQKLAPAPLSRERYRPAELTFEDFYRNEFPGLVRRLMALAKNRSDAEDLAQEAFLQAKEHWASLKAPKAWVFRVALHNLSRQQSRQHRELLPLTAPTLNAIGDATGQDDFRLVETRVTQASGGKLMVAVEATFTPRQRRVYQLSVVEGLTGPALAAELGTSVPVAHHGARRVRRLALERFGALMLARDGWARCSDLERIICEATGAPNGGEERFDRQLCLRIIRHVSASIKGDNCATCRRTLSRLMADYAP